MDNAIGTGELLRMMGSLVLVLALVVGTLWFWRWLQQRGLQRTGRTSQLQIQETLMVGARQKVALLRAGPLNVLVGITPTGVTALAQWPVNDSACTDETEALS
jgi:flagellar protein FliO/FliZ